MASTNMLLREYEHTIDDKNRLTLPARFRDALSEGVVVTRGMDGCLYKRTRGRLAGAVPVARRGSRSAQQRGSQAAAPLSSGAAEAELDKQEGS